MRFMLASEDLNHVLTFAQSDLESLRGARLFLTGCTGFFGKWLIESLLWADIHLKLALRLIVLSRNPEAFLATMPHLRGGDRLQILRGGVEEMNEHLVPPFTHAIHAANLPNDGRPDWPSRHIAAAVTGMCRIMELASRYGCSTVLLTSSGGAYRAEPDTDASASSPSRTLRERQQGACDNLREPVVYGTTKRFLEILASAEGTTREIRVPLARCFAFVGPYMPLGGGQAVGNFMQDALNGVAITINGDGTPLRSYLYSADLVVWLLALLARGRHGTPYNIGSDQAVNLREAAQAISCLAGTPDAVNVLGKVVEGNAPSVYVPDIARAREELGLEVRIPLAEALQRTFCWFRSIH